MPHHIELRIAAVLLASAGLAASVGPAIVERFDPGGPPTSKFTKVAVVGISPDQALRHRIENKLVSHLRGRGLVAVASYTLVEDLAAPGDPQALLDRVLTEGIDGVITLRAFPLAKQEEKPWADSWQGGWDEEQTLRSFVAESLPLAEKKGDRYGLDFAGWSGSPFHPIWAGRTAIHPGSRLRKSSGELVQSVIDSLENAELF